MFPEGSPVARRPITLHGPATAARATEGMHVAYDEPIRFEICDPFLVGGKILGLCGIVIVEAHQFCKAERRVGSTQRVALRSIYWIVNSASITTLEGAHRDMKVSGGTRVNDDVLNETIDHLLYERWK